MPQSDNQPVKKGHTLYDSDGTPRRVTAAGPKYIQVDGIRVKVFRDTLREVPPIYGHAVQLYRTAEEPLEMKERSKLQHLLYLAFAGTNRPTFPLDQLRKAASILNLK